MNTNMTGFRWFSNFFVSLFLDESSLSNGRVSTYQLEKYTLFLHIVMTDYKDHPLSGLSLQVLLVILVLTN